MDSVFLCLKNRGQVHCMHTNIMQSSSNLEKEKNKKKKKEDTDQIMIDSAAAFSKNQSIERGELSFEGK